MQMLREVFRVLGRMLRYAGQFLLSLLRLYRLARRIRLNVAGWPALPAQVALAP